MFTRFFIAICLLTGLVLIPVSGTASEILAKADTRMPEAEPFQTEAPSIDKVLVRKGERRLYLMDDGQVVKSYRISLGDNPTGHKLYEGDERTPEGDYTLDWRNAGSDFYKSIHISYPSERDRELANAWGLNPGGSIMIHGLPNEAADMAFAYQGLDWTDGCIAVTNEEMDEIWQLVADGTPIRIVP
ncbi:L,D-transpeptidase family protein [Marinobacter arenosus]|uniref:L,D-transpeptidase family protein n=1 Tax=Marinobacter arenosus TaxID=2856822 RepID=UPI001C4C74ED|nr:L,D-transpeptidase family protein [Marinobacter arenosus]